LSRPKINLLAYMQDPRGHFLLLQIIWKNPQWL